MSGRGTTADLAEWDRRLCWLCILSPVVVFVAIPNEITVVVSLGFALVAGARILQLSARPAEQITAGSLFALWLIFVVYVVVGSIQRLLEP